MAYDEIRPGVFEEEDTVLSDEQQQQIARRQDAQRDKEEAINEYAASYAKEFTENQLEEKLRSAYDQLNDIESGNAEYSDGPFMEVRVVELALKIQKQNSQQDQ